MNQINIPEIKIEHAHSPKMEENGSVTLMVKFEHLDMEIPFTATLYDRMKHGPELHARALQGEFGVVTPYTPLTAQEISDNKKNSRMETAVNKVQHYTMMNDDFKIAEWKAYYAEVYNGVIDPVEPAE